ncbi:MAG: hypothetical protein ACFE85_06185 [Candidatus Hodarchaeota archaeon]
MTKWIDKVHKRIRNISLIILILGFLLMIIWMIIYLYKPNKELQFILVMGIVLFLAGTLAFTRIQFVIWLQKRITKKTI